MSLFWFSEKKRNRDTFDNRSKDLCPTGFFFSSAADWPSVHPIFNVLSPCTRENANVDGISRASSNPIRVDGLQIDFCVCVCHIIGVHQTSVTRNWFCLFQRLIVSCVWNDWPWMSNLLSDNCMWRPGKVRDFLFCYVFVSSRRAIKEKKGHVVTRWPPRQRVCPLKAIPFHLLKTLSSTWWHLDWSSSFSIPRYHC